MKVFGDVANSIDPDIEVEIDFPSKHPSKMLAILDMQMGMVGNKVQYKFYRKPMHLSPNVSTSGRIFGRAEVGHTTMGTLSGL